MRQWRYTVGMPTERVVVATMAWCRWDVGDPDLTVMLRFDRGPSGRLVIAEMAVAAAHGVSADHLRTLPVGRIESWANGPGRDRLVADLDARQVMTGAELEVLDDRHRGRRTAAAGGTQVVVGHQAVETGRAQPGSVRIQVNPRWLRLRVPEGKPKPDTFYKRVSEVYGRAAAGSTSPAKLVAEANGVPVGRVHGWVQEARRRGLMAPGERQRRSRKQ